MVNIWKLAAVLLAMLIAAATNAGAQAERNYEYDGHNIILNLGDINVSEPYVKFEPGLNASVWSVDIGPTMRDIPE